MEEEGVILLSAPVGSEEFVGREVAKKVEKQGCHSEPNPIWDGHRKHHFRVVLD